MKFKINQRVVYPASEYKRYFNYNPNIRDYGIIKEIKKRGWSEGMVARVHVGEGIVLSFNFDQLKPYILNNPDEV